MPRLLGCYEALDGLTTTDIIVDFTGTLAETVDMQKGRYTELVEEKYKLFGELYKTFTKGGLICCTIEVCCLSKTTILCSHYKISRECHSSPEIQEKALWCPEN